jgi:hypothetical protein
LPLAGADTFSLQYRDSEGDWIELLDDVDVLHAVSLSPVVSLRVNSTTSAFIAAGDQLEAVEDLKRQVKVALESLQSVLEQLKVLNLKSANSSGQGQPESPDKKSVGSNLKPLTSSDMQDFLGSTNRKSPEPQPPSQAQEQPPSQQQLQPPPQTQNQPQQQQQNQPQQPSQAQQQQAHADQQAAAAAAYYHQQFAAAGYGYHAAPNLAINPYAQQAAYPGHPQPSPSAIYPPNAPMYTTSPPQILPGRSTSQSTSSSSLQPLPPALTQGLQMPQPNAANKKG